MFKPKFYAKCKSSLKTTKTRIEVLKKKKGSVVKFLKSDIAELLRTGLDYNAYCRAEGVMIEQDRLSCYHLIDQFVGCISSNLSAMQKQRECPEECREAVASLIYATARFSEFPELRDLRTLFTEKYGNSLEPFTSKEFVEKLSSKTVTKEMKLQLMHDIAQEFSIDWDAKSLEQKLYKLPSSKQESTYDSYNMKTDDDAYNQKKSRDGIIQEDMTIDKVAHHQARKGVKNGGHNQQSSSDDESAGGMTSSTSVDSCSEDEVSSKIPLFSKFKPPPYFKAKAEREESRLAEEYSKPENNFAAVVEENNHRDDSVQEEKPKPISVRRRNLKPPPGRENIGSTKTNLASNTILNGKKQKEPSHEMDEEEKELDELLTHYTKNDLPGEPSKGKPYIKPPPSHYKPENAEGSTRQRNTKLSVPPGRAASMPAEPTTPTESHARSNSLQPETLAGHVHPKLPDYDNLAAQIAALKGR
ncbi:uncharacterized protein LOC120007899 isoform X2 [Tripterygium wilfordii]|uniref:uncharacterized protein LOC120007899 isoform X2 n=1 Tax=Tripterygium wilfordii TaxID=458696 RepID=UPI0018F7EFCD|nr:uncharacterized protein LOC120007899 isoform X2 [Tripterygium wilfordii]